mgnify:CR=1 FL=1
MGNVKISELPYVSRIDDDALVVLVQDHANKVVTVDELSQKINEKQNHTIDHLWHELRRATGMETVRAISNTVSNHEYRIDGIEKLNGKQDRQLASLTNAMREISARQHSHHDDITILKKANIENRRSLAYLNFRMDDVVNNTYTYFNNISQIQADLAAAIQTHKDDLAYTYKYIKEAAETAQENCYTYTYSAYAYLTNFVHFGGDEYWGIINGSTYSLYGTWADNYVPTTKGSDTSNTDNKNQCTPGCSCGQ